MKKERAVALKATEDKKNIYLPLKNHTYALEMVAKGKARVYMHKGRVVLELT